jgi:acyl-coenzyme A thioesterase PaaI-like protein
MRDTSSDILRFPSESGCFGCSSENASGLRLIFRRTGEEIRSDYVIEDRFHGAPGIAHGGIVASIFDEVSCAAVFFMRGRHVVTGELTVRYEKPCPVEVALVFRARITDETHAKYAIVVSEAFRDGALLARSTGKFFYVERATSAP